MALTIGDLVAGGDPKSILRSSGDPLSRKLVFERPDVDVSGLTRIGRHERVVGVTYVTDKRQAEFFDPALQALRASLGKALPGKLISLVDASLDENKLFLFAGSDIDPGTYYLFDPKNRQLEEVMPVRTALGRVTRSECRDRRIAADGRKT